MPQPSLAEVEATVKHVAARLGEPTGLPTFGYTVDGGHPHVEVDGRGYHYVSVERGQEQRRDTTATLDELLYWIFRDATFGIAVAYELAHRVAGQDFRRILFARQVELISRLDPRWRERCADEQREILRKHPFDDLSDIRVDYCVELRRQGHDDAAAWAMACERYPLPPAEG